MKIRIYLSVFSRGISLEINDSVALSCVVLVFTSHQRSYSEKMNMNEKIQVDIRKQYKNISSN